MRGRNTNKETTQVCNTPTCLTAAGFMGRCCSKLVGLASLGTPLPSSPDMEHSSQTGDLAWRTASSMLIISRWDQLKPPQGQEGEFGIRNVKGGMEGKEGERKKSRPIKKVAVNVKSRDSKIKARMIKGQRNRNLFRRHSCLFLIHPDTAVSMAIYEPNLRFRTHSAIFHNLPPHECYNPWGQLLHFLLYKCYKSEKGDAVGPPLPVGGRLPIAH